MHKIVTSPAFIARLAGTLDQMQAEPPVAVACPADFEDYQLSFSVSGPSRPAVVVRATESGCGGAQITVNGRAQPALADHGAVAALVRQVVSATPEISAGRAGARNEVMTAPLPLPLPVSVIA